MHSFQDAVRSLTEQLPRKRGDSAEAHLQTLLRHPLVQQFRREHPELTRDAFARSLNRIAQYVRERDHCDRCPGLTQCPNVVSGHQPTLVPYAGYIDLHVQPCALKRQEEQEKKRRARIRSHYVPADVLAVTFETLDFDGARKEAIIAASTFAASFQPSEHARGLYLYGDFGVGKSCIAAAMAHELAQRDISVFMVYVPEFFRELKESLQDGSSAHKIEAVKTVDVLILDDLGAEVISPWVRDDVLGSILQYRVANKLPTVYTSNLSYEELEEHLAYSQKNGFEALKAKRIMERIRHETDAYYVGGSNRRGGA